MSPINVNLIGSGLGINIEEEINKRTIQKEMKINSLQIEVQE